MPMDSLIATPRGTITLRLATEADVALLRDLRLEALRTHPEMFSADYATHRDQPMTFWTEWVRQRTSGQAGIIQVASIEESLVGMSGLHRSDAPKTWHSGSIWGVYVRPAWRGLHIAERLLAECMAWARTQHMRLVKLAVVTTNTAAIRCYTRCGFTVYGLEPQTIHHNGVYYDELLMAQPL
jgi:RimJ/RimL family protein N-acetyltransferase